MRRQSRQGRVLLRLLQALGRHAAAGTEAHHAIRAALALHRHFLPPDAGAGLHIQLRLGEGNGAAQGRKGRDRRAQAHTGLVLVHQGHQALDPGVFAPVQRDVQRQLQSPPAAAARLTERAAGPLAHGRGRQKAQQVVHRPCATALDGQVRVIRPHVLDPARHLAQHKAPRAQGAQHAARVFDEHALALEAQQPFQRRERRPDALCRIGLQAQQRRGHIVHDHLTHRHPHTEAPPHIVLERESVQLALDLERHPFGVAAAEGLAHIVTRVGRNAQGQVAPHAGGLAARQTAVHLKHPWQSRQRLALGIALPGGGGAPGGVQRACGVGIGETGLTDLHRPIRRRARHRAPRPVHARLKLVQRDAGLFEHAGKRQPALLHDEIGPSARLGGRHSDIGLRQSRSHPLWGRRQTQALDARLDPVTRGRRRRPFPTQIQPRHDPLGRQLLQRLAVGRRQRQAIRHPGQQGQVQMLGLGLPALRLTPGLRHVHQRVGRMAPHQAPLAEGPRQAVVQLESQLLERQGGLVGAVVQAQSAIQAPEAQRRQCRVQAHIHAPHTQLQAPARQPAFFQAHGGAHRAPPASHLDRQAHMTLQRLHIHMRQVQHHRAGPALPVAGPGQGRPPALPPGSLLIQGPQGLGHVHLQTHPLTELARRCGGQRQLMVATPQAQAVTQGQIHLLQAQGGTPPQLIGPAQTPVADLDQRLRQHPVGPGR